jgi:hypothetical protein
MHWRWWRICGINIFDSKNFSRISTGNWDAKGWVEHAVRSEANNLSRPSEALPKRNYPEKLIQYRERGSESPSDAFLGGAANPDRLIHNFKVSLLWISHGNGRTASYVLQQWIKPPTQPWFLKQPYPVLPYVHAFGFVGALH